MRTAKESSALKLTLRTAEGDTVEISLEARSLRQSERSSARGPGGRISQKTNTQSNSLTASVNVTGELSDAELEDIQGLLQSLAGGGGRSRYHLRLSVLLPAHARGQPLPSGDLWLKLRASPYFALARLLS